MNDGDIMIKLSDLKCINENIDLNIYLDFIDSVKKTMEHPEWLGDFTKEDLEVMLKENTKIYMYYLNDNIVCTMMSIPSTPKALKKFEIDLDHNIVVDYGPMAVGKDYIGNGLQYQMLKELDEISIKDGYEYVAATIHPENIYSIRNLLKDDFKQTGQKEFKRGIRNIYLKKLK